MDSELELLDDDEMDCEDEHELTLVDDWLDELDEDDIDALVLTRRSTLSSGSVLLGTVTRSQKAFVPSIAISPSATDPPGVAPPKAA